MFETSDIQTVVLGALQEDHREIIFLNFYVAYTLLLVFKNIQVIHDYFRHVYRLFSCKQLRFRL